MEEAIEVTLARLDDSTMRSLTITENPSGVTRKKSFDIKNTDTKKEDADSVPCSRQKTGLMKVTTTTSITTHLKINSLHITT